MNTKPGLFSRVLHKIMAPAMRMIPATYLLGVNRARWNRGTYEGYAREGFMANPYMFAAVTQCQVAMKGIKVSVQEVQKDGKFKELDEDDPVRRLMDRPSDVCPSWPKFVEAMVGYKMIGGQAFALGIAPEGFPTPPNSTTPRLLNALGCNAVAIKAGERLGTIAGFEYKTATGEIIQLTSRDVFWWGSFNPLDELAGTSVLEPADRTLQMNNSTMDYNKAILDNGGYVGTVLTSESPGFGKVQADQLKDSLKEQYSGAQNAGNNLILWGGVKPYKVGITPQEMGYENLITLTSRQISLVTGVPPEMLGDASQKTFSNYREAVQSFYTGTILPMADDFYSGLGAWLSRNTGRRLVFTVDLDDVEALSSLREAAKDSIRKDWQAGLITQREAREYEGWSADPAEDDDSGFYSGQQPMILQASGGKGWVAYLKSAIRRQPHA